MESQNSKVLLLGDSILGKCTRDSSDNFRNFRKNGIFGIRLKSFFDSDEKEKKISKIKSTRSLESDNRYLGSYQILRLLIHRH